MRRSSAYWVVHVVSPEDNELGIPRVERKFEFEDKDEAEARSCHERAARAGFTARLDRVRHYREEKVSS